MSLNALFYLSELRSIYECTFPSSYGTFQYFVIILTKTLCLQYCSLGSPASQIILKYCSVIWLGRGQGFCDK